MILLATGVVDAWSFLLGPFVYLLYCGATGQVPVTTIELKG